MNPTNLLLLFILGFYASKTLAESECIYDTDCFYRGLVCSTSCKNGQCPGPSIYLACFSEKPAFTNSTPTPSQCSALCAQQGSAYSAYLASTKACGCVTNLQKQEKALNLSETGCLGNSEGVAYYWIITNGTRCPYGELCSPKNACVQCVADQNCASQHCLSGTCVDCTTDIDCRSETSCDATCSNNTCKPGTLNCAKNPNKPLCLVEEGTCVQCFSDSFCQTNQTCDGSCQNGVCSSTLNCTADPIKHICNVLSGKCQECITSDECDHGKICRSSDGTCVQCTENVQCQSNDDCRATCKNGTCVAGGLNCTAQFDVCRTSDSTCVDCLTSKDCPSGFDCTSNKCTECTQAFECRRMYKDPLYAYCNDGVCGECQVDVECRVDQNCNGTCAPANSKEHRLLCVVGGLNCTASNSYCIDQDQNPTCVQCRIADDCPASAKYCIDHKCIACRDDNDCFSPQNCDGKCQDGKCISGTLVCNGTTPYCYDRGICVECLGNTNCPVADPYCYNHDCVECVITDHCRSITRCDSLCRSDNTCSPGTQNCTALGPHFICTATGMCRECETTADCTFDPTLPYCNGTACVACLETSDCRTANNCNGTCTKFECVPGGLKCTGDTRHCNINEGECVQCLGPQDCGDGFACSSNNTCLCMSTNACRSEGNCNATCEAMSCVPGGLNCTALGFKCALDLGICFECNSSSDCPASRPTCHNYYCVACLKDSDCGSDDTCGGSCNAGVCTDGLNCATLGKKCSLGTNATCVTCLGDGDCGDLLKGCDNGECAISFRSAWKVFVPAGVGVLLVLAGVIFLVRRATVSRDKYTSYEVVDTEPTD